MKPCVERSETPAERGSGRERPPRSGGASPRGSAREAEALTIDLEHHVAALRASGDDGDAQRALATRLRLRRSLEADHRVRRQLVSVAAALAILLVGTASWALVTGNLPRLWPHLHEDAPLSPPPRPAPVQHALPAPVVLPPAEPVVIPPPPPPVAHPRTVHRAAPAPVEALYRKAHELHFHGDDVAAALAAWDDYLAAEPAGTFAVEARYNRALCLIRLGRLAEARAALLPFAHDQVEPHGYRHAEAAALLDRIGLNE